MSSSINRVSTHFASWPFNHHLLSGVRLSVSYLPHFHGTWTSAPQRDILTPHHTLVFLSPHHVLTHNIRPTEQARRRLPGPATPTSPWRPTLSKAVLVCQRLGECIRIEQERITDTLSSSVFGAKVATIEVGPHRKKYYIHEALLAHYSEYFRKALRGPWKEAEEGVVRLEDVDHRACKLRHPMSQG